MTKLKRNLISAFEILLTLTGIALFIYTHYLSRLFNWRPPSLDIFFSEVFLIFIFLYLCSDLKIWCKKFISYTFPMSNSKISYFIFVLSLSCFVGMLSYNWQWHKDSQRMREIIEKYIEKEIPVKIKITTWYSQSSLMGGFVMIHFEASTRDFNDISASINKKSEDCSFMLERPSMENEDWVNSQCYSWTRQHNWSYSTDSLQILWNPLKQKGVFFHGSSG